MGEGVVGDFFGSCFGGGLVRWMGVMSYDDDDGMRI